MKITEAWGNRELVIEKCKEKRACIEEFKKLIRAKKTYYIRKRIAC